MFSQQKRDALENLEMVMPLHKRKQFIYEFEYFLTY